MTNQILTLTFAQCQNINWSENAITKIFQELHLRSYWNFGNILWRHNACKCVIADDVASVQGEIMDFILFKVCFLTSALLQTVLWNCIRTLVQICLWFKTTLILTLTFAQGHMVNLLAHIMTKIYHKLHTLSELKFYQCIVTQKA